MRKQTRRTKYSSPINFGDIFKGFQLSKPTSRGLSHKAQRKVKKDQVKPKKLTRVSKGMGTFRIGAQAESTAIQLSEETRSLSTVSIKSQLKENQAFVAPPISCTELIEPIPDNHPKNIEVSKNRKDIQNVVDKKEKVYQSLSQGSQQLFQTPDSNLFIRTQQKPLAMDSEPDEGSRNDSISLLGIHEPNSLQQSERDRREDYKIYRTYDSLSPVNPALVKEIFDSMLRHFMPRIKYHRESRLAFERKYQLPTCYEGLISNFKMLESAMYNLTAQSKPLDYSRVNAYCWEVHKKYPSLTTDS